jgi:hypothetical protein
MPPEGLEPAILASEGQQSQALERAATRISYRILITELPFAVL